MFVKAKDKKLYEEVVKQIKYLIDTKELKEGDRLPSEEKLSKNIGVSRATIREGLRTLSLMGLVETKRGKGTFVTVNKHKSFKAKLDKSINNIDVDSYYVYQVDMLLEPNIVKLVAETAEEEDIRRIKLSIEKMEQSIEEGGTGEEESLYFHKCIIDTLKNPILNSIFELTREIRQRDRKLVLHLPSRAEETLREHHKIYEAIKDRNGKRASQYMKKHLEKVGHTYNQIYSLIDKRTEEPLDDR